MTKIVAISDSHNLHNQITVPKCDILIHAGDFSMMGGLGEVSAFFKWFNDQPAAHKVFCAGNHEVGWSRDSSLRNSMLEQYPGIHYLEDTSIELEGLKIYGSPFSPVFGSWSYMLPRGKPLQDKWAKIPDDTDILITHGPCYGFGDEVSFTGEKVGCWDLLYRVKQIKGIKAHISGHVHSQPQQVIQNGGITFVNASIVDDRYRVANKPVELEL